MEENVVVVVAEDRNSTECFICSSSLNDQWQLMEDGTSLFDFMCRDLLPFGFLLRPGNGFRKVKNCELCDSCAALIRNGIEIEKNVEFLKNNLKTVAKTLQDLIASSYHDSQKKGSEDVTGPLKSLKTMFAQCLSTCRVLLPKIPKEYELLLPTNTVNEEDTALVDKGTGPRSQRPGRKRKLAAILPSAESVVVDSSRDSVQFSTMESEEDEDREDEDFIVPEIELGSDAEELEEMSGRKRKRTMTTGTDRKRVKRSKGEALRKPRNRLSFLCKFCIHKFLKDDFKTTDGGYNFECKLEKCPKLLNSFYAFVRHHDRFCLARPRESSQCDTESNKQKVKRRKDDAPKKPRNVLSFFCKFCNHKFLRDDFKTTDGDYKFECKFEKCPKLFNDFYGLMRHHDKFCLARPLETFQCDLCGATLSSEKYLQEHRNRHLQTFEFYCDQCGKGFVSKGALKSHMLSHTGEKRFKCDLCDQSYKRKAQLQAHILRHNDEKPYVCATCGKGFVLQQGLKYHEEGHIGEKKHPCQVCGRLFHSVLAKHTHIYHAHTLPARKKQMRLTKEKDDDEEVGDSTSEDDGVMNP